MRPRRDSYAGSLRTTVALSKKVIVSCFVAVVLVGTLGFSSRASETSSGYDVVPADSTAPPNAQAVYQAANAVQGVNAYFRLTGLSLLPPASLTETWELGLDLRGVGTSEKQEPLGGAQLTPDGRRIEYAYTPASLSAWFVNNEDGLRHGVSLDAPLGESANKVFVDLAVSGNLTPRLSDGGEVIEFVTASGAAVLSMGPVEVVDAVGEKVHAYVEVMSDQEVRLWVEVAGAAYPVTAEWATVRIAPQEAPTPNAPDATITVCNTASITIPGSGTGASTGAPASPYPSNITVSGVGLISKVTVNLKGLNHTFPGDVDLLLVGPGGGTKLISLSDVIGGTDWVGINYTLDDAAAALVPSSGTPVSGTFKPTNYGTGDVFPAPAPASPYQNAATAGSATFASVFGGTNADGIWSLYVVDDASGDTGTMTGGWCLNLTQGCVTNGNCDDSSPCTTDTCVSGSCVYTATCNDNDACTTDLCDTGTGACSHGVTNCDDLNPCTDDSCAPATGCAHTNNTVSCNDGNPCTLNDTCSGGACVGGPGNCPVAQICNPGSVTVPAGAPGTTSGPAAPYPSAILVGGFSYVAKVTVDLKGLNHTFPDDFDVLLVGPAGQNAKIMSDVGSLTDIVNVNLTLSDTAASSLPDGGPIVSGTFKPTDVNDGTDTFPAPAPVPSGGSALSVFNGTNPVGTWNLFVVDDANLDVGSMTGGWCLNITHPCTNDAECSDNNPCTTDTCDVAASSCSHTDNTAPCNDGNACTSGDTCGGGSCAGTGAVVCNDGNACTDDLCNPSTGCYAIPNSGPCDDGDACTTNDQCVGPATCGATENFDGVVAPALPAGWSSTTTGSGSVWVTQIASSDTAPNSAFAVDGAGPAAADEVLTSPPIAITSAAATVSFRNRWSFESATSCFDAGVLEIKIGAGAFTDIVTAGGSFVSGGYTGVVSGSFSNPLAGRSAWCNASPGYPAYVTTVVNLPAAAAGQTIQLQWRVGVDISIAGVGQNIDTIVVSDVCPTTCTGGPPPICDDGNGCTDNSCDPATGCVFTNNTDPCDDGSACTANDTCGGGNCNGTTIVCDDGNVCTDNSCDPATGCFFTNNTDPCQDGDACTTGDICGGGVCNPGGATNCDDGECCTNDLCDHDTGCYHTPYTVPPVITTQPSLSCALLWPPQHGYVDFTVANTGAAATSLCGIASITFNSCTSSQQENAHGTGDGNSNRDCVYSPGTLSVRAERDGACSPIGRSYSSTVVATDVCGNVSAPSNSFDIGVFHDRGHAPAGPYYSANPGSNQNDTRTGVNGTYGTGCGSGTCGATGSGEDNSDEDPEMEINQAASISVGDLGLEKASGGNVKLTWTEPTHQSGVIVTRFHVYRLDPVTLFWIQLAEVTKQTTSYLDPVLTDGVNRQYKVTAVIKP